MIWRELSLNLGVGEGILQQQDAFLLVFHADMKVTDWRKKSAYVSALIVALVSIDQE